MIKEYKVCSKNSQVNGQPGRYYDWSKFCWNDKEIYIEKCHVKDCDHKHEYKAYPAFVDGDDKNCHYLHVPYNWTEDCTVFRVYPNDCMWVNKIFRGRKVIKQTAIKKDDGWYWQLELEDKKC
ncbi:MAG: hypothetical protein WC389_18710 [Lutibacter sp.]|jgi:hypothetical protein